MTETMELVEAPADAAYEMMDSVDQSQVMALERGDVLNGLVYHFFQYNPETKERDKDVFGLTIAGVFDVARNYFQQKGYRFTSTIVDEQFTDKHCRTLVRGTLMDKEGVVFLSLDRACRVPRFRGKFEDEFADRKSQSIAERNILRRMIPEATVIKTIKEFVKKGLVIYLTPNESFSSLPAIRIKAKRLAEGGVIKTENAKVAEPVHDSGELATAGQIASIEDTWEFLELDVAAQWALLEKEKSITRETLTADRAAKIYAHYAKQATSHE